MDKQTLLVAEQVGLFLIPMLRELAKAQVTDSFAVMQAGLAEMRSVAEQHRTTLAGEITALRSDFDGTLRNLEKELGGLATAASVSELRLETGASLADLGTALKEAREDMVSRAEKLRADTAVALKAFEDAEAKTVTVKTEPDYEAISAEVSRAVAVAVQAIKLPEPLAPDLGPVLEECRATVASEVRVAVPALRESLAVNIADEVSRAVSVAVQAIKLPDPPAPDLAPLLDFCRGHIADEIEASAPALRESLAANVRDEVSRAVSSIKLPELDLPGIAEECRSAATAAVAAELPRVRDSLAANVRDEVSRTIAALPKPKDGEPGPAGLMAAAEPYIEGEVYERLALVSHAGGTWQATRRTKTAPAANLGDWQAIAVGVARVSAQASDDLRTVEVVAALTDGTEFKHAVEVPAMVYRDVFDDTEEYVQADVVTHAGSLWLALKETKGEQPSKSPEAWRLIVKRGQDGRSGKDGDHGVQFQAGYAGEYEEQRAYPMNSIVTYSGSTWLSKRPTKERPPYLTNADSEHWLRLR